MSNNLTTLTTSVDTCNFASRRAQRGASGRPGDPAPSPAEEAPWNVSENAITACPENPGVTF